MITITHTHAAGTLIEGSRKGDGVYEILTGLRASGQGNWRSFRSLGQIGLGQSRDKAAQSRKIEKAAEALRAAGHDVTVEADDSQRRTVAEREADRAERAQDRAAYHSDVAGSAAAKSAAAWQAEHGILDMIPMGQPILVGHHSEGRHRRDLARAESLRRRGMAEADRSEYHEHRAEAAEATQAQRESIPTTLRRIEKLSADLRRVERDIAGREDWVDNGSGDYELKHVTPGPRYLARLEARKADLEEQIAYWREHVKAAEAAGVKVWGPGDFAKGDYVRNDRRWYQVERVNPKSLSVPHGNNDHLLPVVTRAEVRHALGPSQWVRKVTYDEVTGRKSAEEMAAILAEVEQPA